MAFASERYGVSFPMFAKVEVNGASAAPLFRLLREAAPNPDGTTDVKWNFTKFLVGRDGSVIKRYQPMTTPEQIADDLAAYL
jgi:glutathione peroxidase